jgi:hypothetical protein
MIERNFITPEILADLDRIDSDCIRMHVPPPPALFVRCEVSDIETGEVELVQEEKANSFVRNYYNWVMSAQCGLPANSGGETFGAGKLPMRFWYDNNVYSSAKKWRSGSYLLPNHNGIVNRDDFGIVIGTGTGAWSFENYKLGTLILHGTTAGKMSYAAAGDPPGFSYDAGTKTVTATVTRVISNTSGGEIVVAETGIMPSIETDGVGLTILIERTLLAATVAVANNKKITVTYTYTMVFPA